MHKQMHGGDDDHSQVVASQDFITLLLCAMNCKHL
jgi:hypothetical protein